MLAHTPYETIYCNLTVSYCYQPVAGLGRVFMWGTSGSPKRKVKSFVLGARNHTVFEAESV